MAQLPRVALLIETSNAYARGLMRGIVAYMREHRPWSIYLSEHSRGEKAPAWLAGWHGDGVIARIENSSVARVLTGLRLPMVDVSAARLLPELPYVETEDRAIAQMAADHFFERGFRQFAFSGDDRFQWSRWRQDHFSRLIEERGLACHVQVSRGTRSRDGEALVEELGAWLARLPKPVGVFASYDFRGQQVLDACRRRRLPVPDEVAVLGVDNDELLCALTDPPISSVILNTHRTGYEAAALLDRLMAGEIIRGEARLVEPLGIATRQSTDVLAIEDQNIARAVRFIRQHACEGICVKDVLRAVPQSRRVLETRFQKLLGRTPHEEILRVQLHKVKTLLTESDLSLEQIAGRAGFSHVEYLSAVFHKKVGLPPSRFRALNRRKRVG